MKKKVNLALQGGGSHGAFTWGVLDRLLEEDSLEIESISGTSAGAINAVVLAYGLSIGGSTMAREKLSEFWSEVNSAGKFGLFKPSNIDKMFGDGNIDFSPSYKFFQSISKFVPPHSLNLLNLNPLEAILKKVINFNRLREVNLCKLFISATHVKSGQLKIFKNDEINLDVIMASACLPLLFQAVEINDELYWDGGYTANPTLFPLITDTESSDIIVVQIEPTNIKAVPTNIREIADRISTLSFNSNLMTEFRAIDLINKLDVINRKAIYLHSIDAENTVQNLHASSKLNTDDSFMQYLFNSGRVAANDFIIANAHKLGQESSFICP